jgi:hypothetical protein
MQRRETMGQPKLNPAQALQPFLATSPLPCAHSRGSAEALATVASALTLDTCGTVRGCDSAAAAAFCTSADALVGQHIKKLLPDLPLRSSTPDFNMAYASFCAAQPVWTRHTINDAAGGATELYVSVQAANRDGDHIIVQVRDPTPPRSTATV